MQLSLVNKFLRYSMVGVICTTIYFLSMFICVEIVSIKPVPSSAISFIVMTIFSYLLNKKYTFGGVYSHSQFVKFSTVASLGFALNVGIMYVIVSVLSFHYFLGELVTVLVIPLINFLLNHYWTFNTE